MPDELLLILPFVLYGTSLVFITFFARTSNFKDDTEYFLGGRNFTWFPALVSVLATEVSVATMMIFPAAGLSGGYALIWLCAGYIVGRTCVALFYLRNIYKFHRLSIYETMTGRDPIARRALSFAYLAAKYISLGVRFFMGAYAMQQLFGWSILGWILLIAVVVGLYTLIGGLKAVVWADQIQGFIIVVVGIALCATLLPSVPEGAFASVPFANTSASIHNPLFFPWLFLGAVVLSIGTHGADQEMIQRVLATKSFEEAKKSLILSGVAAAIVTLIYITIGFFLRFQGMEGLNPKSPLVDFVARSDRAFLKGWFAVLLLAASMSTLSAAVNTLGAIWKNALDSNRPGIIWSLLSLVLLAGAAGGFIPLHQFKPDFLSLAMGSMNYVNGALIGIFTVYVFAPGRLRARGILAAVITGFSATFICDWVVRPAIGWTLIVIISAGLSLFACFAAGMGTSAASDDQPNG